MSVLTELEAAVRAIARDVGAAVVGLGAGWGHGSGIVVAPGRVLTNAHNIRGGDVEVIFANGRSATGDVAGADPDGDVAVVTVDTGDVTPVGWAAEAPAAGTVVFALANPGGRGLRTTYGLVSATRQAFRGPRGRRIAGGLEHTAPLPRGASGGPVVNAAGELVGVNTHRLGEGFYLALPADAELHARVQALGAGEEPHRPRLGIAIAPPRMARRLREAVGLPPLDGLLVQGVEEGSAAHRAGLRRGDLLVSADGRPLASSDALFSTLDGLAPGAQLRLGVVRGADEVEVTVTLA